MILHPKNKWIQVELSFDKKEEEFELDKVEKYTTEQLQEFLDEIEQYWVKTNELYSMTDLLEINRELTIREEQK